MLDGRYPDVVPGPPKPSLITQPQVFSLPPGTERYVVEGGGAMLIRIEAGDKLTVSNTEGGQPCEIIAASPDGVVDPAIPGQAGAGNANGLKPEDYRLNDDGVPVLHNCLASFECKQRSIFEGGDHAIVLGQVVRATYQENREALGFFGGKIGRFVTIDNDQ